MQVNIDKNHPLIIALNNLRAVMNKMPEFQMSPDDVLESDDESDDSPIVTTQESHS